MATEKQLAANRTNAKRSTGPRTLAGKMKSSRNAFRHGLSYPKRLDAATLARVDAIARMLAGDLTDERRRAAATEAALAQMDLLEVRRVRAEMMATTDPRELRRLVALDRYERIAQTKRRRAARKL